ncbi:MAG TPA: NfeD family protein [Candidatus Acidoferrales bacterium]|nr:NfeD family protein [Candidatus Acidoferrales bacterium]
MNPRFLLCAAGASVFTFASPAVAPSASQPSSTVVVLRIDGEIEPVLAEYLLSGIDQAAQEHVRLTLITINTPGGLDSAMRSIIQKILRSPVPVVTYVMPTGSRAASAGFFILLSGDVAAMSPGTDMGAASPLLVFGGTPVQIDENVAQENTMHLLPVNLTGLVLVVLALGLFMLEAKFPSHGVLGVGGVVAMILGALMLVRSQLTGMGVSLGMALGVTIPFALIIIFLMRLVMRSLSWKQSTGAEQLVGEVGEVAAPVEASGSQGMVFVHGELWRAAAPQGIPRRARVRVKRVEGLTLQVEPVETPQPSASS